MSSAGNSVSGSRPSNGSYPAQSDSGPETPESDHRPNVPTPEERIREIIDEFPERAFRPVSETHGRKLRADCMEEPDQEARSVEVGDHDEIDVEELVGHEALPWIGAVQQLFDQYEGYRDKYLKMGRGSEIYGDYESFEVKMDMSYSPVYQSRQYARLKGFERQLLGGEFPNGETCEGEYAEPVTVLFGLTASSLEGGEFRPAVDHDREIREAWSGSSNSVKRTLRYVLEDGLGLSPGDYAWWWQSEPHPGEGAAAGYSHSHPVVVFDRAEVTAEAAEPTDPETYRPVVAKHVSLCENAQWEAHDLEKSVSVREGDDIEDFASYVAEYVAVSPDEDLLERSPEYIMWAASQYASSTQKYSRSRWATEACKADKCAQEYRDGEAEQDRAHGEAVVRSARAGIEYECAECGSAHGIDQSEESLARYRLNQAEAAGGPGATAEVATDGGVSASGHESDESGRTLAERWPSARAVASVGSETRAKECGHEEPDQCPLCATETEAPNHTVSGEVPIPESAEASAAPTVSEGEVRAPEWRPEAVVQKASDEETEIGSPGGVEYAEVVVPGAGSITRSSALDYLPPVEMVAGPEPWEGTELFTEREVRTGQVPPPELVAREIVEATQTGRRVTNKEWSRDWYAERYECESPVDVGSGLSSTKAEAVRELVRVEGVESVPAVMGQLGINPSLREEVASVVEGCRS